MRNLFQDDSNVTTTSIHRRFTQPDDCRFIPRPVRNGVFDPQPKAQAFALMASNLQTPAPSATGQTRPHFRPRDG
jgi:hypothetical protein